MKNNLSLLKCPGCGGRIIISKNDFACYSNENCKYYNGEKEYLKNNKPFFSKEIISEELKQLENKTLSLKEKADIKNEILKKYIAFCRENISL